MDAKEYNDKKKRNKVAVSPVKSSRASYIKDESEYFGPIPTVRATKKIDRNMDLWLELEEWAETTDAIHISEFCTPRKFSYKMLKNEAETNPLLKESLEKAMDRVAKNIREKWQMDYRLGELCKMYLPIFDRAIRDHKMELTKMVSEKIAANAGTTINIIDSSGYLTKKEDKKDTHARAREDNVHDVTIDSGD